MFPEVDHAEGPLTHARVVSGSLHHEESQALLEAAGNLLTKAATRLVAGDEDGARKLAERALHLPFDDFEEVHPASWWLELEMSTRLTEEVELAAEGDSRWLGRVETLLGELSGTAAAIVRNALRDVLSEFPLPRPEERRAHQLIEAVGQESPGEMKEVDELVAMVRALNRQSDLYAQDLHA